MCCVPEATLRKYFALSLDGVGCYYLHFTDVEMECWGGGGWGVKSRGQDPIAFVRAGLHPVLIPSPRIGSFHVGPWDADFKVSPACIALWVFTKGGNRKKRMPTSNLPLWKPRRVWNYGLLQPAVPNPATGCLQMMSQYSNLSVTTGTVRPTEPETLAVAP